MRVGSKGYKVLKDIKDFKDLKDLKNFKDLKDLITLKTILLHQMRDELFALSRQHVDHRQLDHRIAARLLAQ